MYHLVDLAGIFSGCGLFAAGMVIMHYGMFIAEIIKVKDRTLVIFDIIAVFGFVVGISVLGVGLIIFLQTMQSIIR